MPLKLIAWKLPAAARAGVRPTLALAAAGLLLSTLWLGASPLRCLR